MLYYPKIKEGKQLIEFTSSITFRGSPLQCSELARRKFVQAPSSQDQKHWLIPIQNLVSFHAGYTATFKAQYYPAIWPDSGLFPLSVHNQQRQSDLFSILSNSNLQVSS